MKRKRSQIPTTEEPKAEKRSPKKRVLLKRNTIIAVRNDSKEFWLARLKQDCLENMEDVKVYWMNGDGFKNLYSVDYGNPDCVPIASIIAKTDCITITHSHNYCLKPESLKDIELKLNMALNKEKLNNADTEDSQNVATRSLILNNEDIFFDKKDKSPEELICKKEDKFSDETTELLTPIRRSGRAHTDTKVVAKKVGKAIMSALNLATKI